MWLLRQAHAYAGLVLGVLLAIFAVTGGILVFKEDVWRHQYSELAAPLEEQTATEYAQAFQVALDRFDDAATAVFVPRPGLPAYHLYTRDGQALIGQSGNALIDEWSWHETVLGFLEEAHFHLLTGDFGQSLGGIVALLVVAMVITGYVIWWPVRRSFKTKHVLQPGLKRPVLLRFHRDLGVLSGLAVILFSLTAAGVIFYPSARMVLNTLFSSGEPLSAPAFVAGEPVRRSAPDGDQVSVALQALPDARLVAWYPPKTNRPVHYFRFKHPEEPHPNGRSIVHVALDEPVVLQEIDARGQPAGEWASYWLYPLHSARVESVAYRVFALLSAIAIAFLSIAGPVAFLRRSAPARRR